MLNYKEIYTSRGKLQANSSPEISRILGKFLVRHGDTLPREAVDAPSLEALIARLDWALSKLF